MPLSATARAELEAAVEETAKAIHRYNAVLAEDALNPLGSYHLDGESVDRDKWRKTIMEIKTGLIKELREMLLQLGRTVASYWLGKPVSQQIPYEDRS